MIKGTHKGAPTLDNFKNPGNQLNPENPVQDKISLPPALADGKRIPDQSSPLI